MSDGKISSAVANNNYINRRDEILTELRTIKTQFLSGNTSGKSFFGIEIITRIVNNIGDKKLIDLSNNRTYANWHIDFISNEFIVLDGNKEKIVNHEDVIIID